MSDPFMQAAIEEAKQGLAEGGIPDRIGDRLSRRDHRPRPQPADSEGQPTLHGEMDAFENAGRRSAAVYRESVLYTTLSPCSMCTGAILLYGIPRVIVGENRTFMGDEDLLRSRGVGVEVIDDPACVAMMSGFIEANPKLWNEDIGE